MNTPQLFSLHQKCSSRTLETKSSSDQDVEKNFQNKTSKNLELREGVELPVELIRLLEGADVYIKDFGIMF